MTIDETRSVIDFASANYPGYLMSEDVKQKTAMVWALEFEKYPMEKIMEAFRIASAQSLDRPPSLPRIRAAIEEIESRVNSETSGFDEEREELRRREVFFQTEEGKQALERNKELIQSIVNGMCKC